MAQLDTLLGDFGLSAQAATIDRALDALFRSSLAVPPGARLPVPSRLNEDGSPIQLGTALGDGHPGLRFVGDVGLTGEDGAERYRAGLAAVQELAVIVGIEREVDAIADLVDLVVPATDPALRRDRAGAFWVGLAFVPGATPRLRLYLNGGWGDDAGRWARVAGFAARFGQGDAWRRINGQLPPALTPLGLAVTVAAGEPLLGTVYLRAFGVRSDDYARLTDAAAGRSSAAAVRRFAAALLGDEIGYPTPGAVMSFGLGPLPTPRPAADPSCGLSAELELCGHCLFRDDAEARVRLLSVIASLELDPGPYLALASALTDGPPLPGPPRVHSFIGVGTKSLAPTLTGYMKPALFP